MLILWASSADTWPYKTKVSLAIEAKEGACYIRRQSSAVRAKCDGEHELRELAATVRFDDRYNQAVSLDDLASGAVFYFAVTSSV